LTNTSLVSEFPANYWTSRLSTLKIKLLDTNFSCSIFFLEFINSSIFSLNLSCSFLLFASNFSFLLMFVLHVFLYPLGASSLSSSSSKVVGVPFLVEEPLGPSTSTSHLFLATSNHDVFTCGHLLVSLLCYVVLYSHNMKDKNENNSTKRNSTKRE
jgi:hypothetical protein